ncbi:MAG TPA: DEAD/DEAH box helicase [Terriglobia bacterium]|nr:DEAD/DEAH box helicase [Terriglobia bacterium]
MKQYNLARLISETESSLISYLASSLPIGNHANQERLGEWFYSLWEERTFKGPFIEAVPPYKQVETLGVLIEGNELGGEQDRVVASRLRPTHTVAEIDGRLAKFARARCALWPGGSSEEQSEREENSLKKLWNLRLYVHQKQAIQHLIRSRKNIVVATGTGSGKTECFLIPLIYDLLSEPERTRSKSGVRALLLYPMNALVEDQMARLRRLLFWINLQAHDCRDRSALLSRQITFGRYTGETPLNANDTSERSVSQEEIHELGEVLFREDMQRNPPDILVTNFTMLEYMLLRNDDRRIFASPELLKLLVLDEIHTYHGTQGMEVATLLRRFRDYLARKQGGEPHYISVGLSATLSTEKKATRKMARFASFLFGSEFAEDAIFTGEFEPVWSNETHGPFDGVRAVKALTHLSDVAPRFCSAFAVGTTSTEEGDNDIPSDEWVALASALQSPMLQDEYLKSNPERIELLGKILRESPLFDRLAQKLASAQPSVISADELAHAVFETGEGAENSKPAAQALAVLLQLVAAARYNGNALLSLRIHLLVREHQQGLLCINPAHRPLAKSTDGWWSELFVVHRGRCKTCQSLAYPVFLCRRCGFVLLEGWIRARTKRILPEKDELLGPHQFRRILFRPCSGISEAERQAFADQKKITLCTFCGLRFPHDDNNAEYRQQAIARHQQECSHGSLIEALEWSNGDKDVRIEVCPYCDQDWLKGQEVITPPSISLYSASTVLLEELKRAIDEPLHDCVNKVLCFTDSRQEAAFIASRLQRTNEDFTFRQLLYRTLNDAGGPLGTRELISQLFEQLESDSALANLFCEKEEVSDPSAIRKRVATLLFRETCTEYRTLESLGACSLIYPESLFVGGRQFLATDPLGRRLSVAEQDALVQAIINWGFRFRRWAVSSGTGVRIDFLDLQRYGYQECSICKQAAGQGTSGLCLRQANPRSRLFNFYRRICHREGAFFLPGDLVDFNRLMGSIWEQVVTAPEMLFRSRLNQPLDSRKPFVIMDGTEPTNFKLRLNWLCLQWKLETDDSPLYRCSVCGSLGRVNVRKVCPVRDCNGTLKETSLRELASQKFSPARHYLHLLRDKRPKPLRVEEHTAQIAPRARREIEKEFREDYVGSIDVISGSTTFELGIDLGSVNAIFLANMPPEIANYRQRAGRAGRRAGMLPIVITYVRERPHDAYFWNRALDFIAGPLRIPRFSPPSHEVLLRHVNAVLFANLVGSFPNPGGLEGPPAGEFLSFCLRPDRKEAILRAATEVQSPIGASIRSVLAANSTLNLAPELCVKNFYERLEHVNKTYIPLREADGAIPVLSDYGILPSYNYPIYVDELRLYECPRTEWPRRDLKLQRDRSIALSEYYPGRIIVAGKVAIKSIGLWEGFEYQPFLYCKRCGHIDTQCSTNTPTACPNGCGDLVRRRAVKPLGGFLGKYEPGLLRQDPEIFLVKGGEYLFDPRGNPPPTFQEFGSGKAIYAARQSSFHIQQSGARMRTFTPRPDAEKPLTLSRCRKSDVSVRGRQYECLVLPEKEGEGHESLYLMHEFTTDILRLRIKKSSGIGELLLRSKPFREAADTKDPAEKEKAETILLWTLAQALSTGGARYLQIDPREIAFTFKYEPNDALLNREIILFDTAAGGAGYCDQMFENLNRVFEEAAEVLNCPENCGDSCYSCLRSYENQAIHARLNRLYLDEGLSRFNKENWRKIN